MTVWIELDETFTVAFGTLPDNVSAGTPASVTVTITDNDIPAVSFTAETVSAGEGDGAVEVTVQLKRLPGHTDNHSGTHDKRDGDSPARITRH